MSSIVTPFAPGNFEIRFRPPAPSRNQGAWQKLIGEKPIGARLEPLPEPRTNWRALSTSPFTQISFFVALLLLQIILPPNFITKVEYEVMPLAGPMIEIPQTKPQPVRAKVQPQPVQPQAPEPQHIAKLIAPRPLSAPKPKPIEVRNSDVPKLEQAPIVAKVDVPDSEPVKPREVKTGLLGDSPAGGGFGDQRGLRGAADSTRGGKT